MKQTQTVTCIKQLKVLQERKEVGRDRGPCSFNALYDHVLESLKSTIQDISEKRMFCLYKEVKRTTQFI